MKIIITGITSFLGINLAKDLIKLGHEVTGVIRPSSQNVKKLEKEFLNNINILRCNIEDLINLDICFDAMIHLAWDGIGSVGRSDPVIQEKNYEISQQAYLAAKKMQCKRFLFSGSQAEYGNGTKDNPKPISEYGKKKLAFGLWGMQMSLKDPSMIFIHMRIFSIYGWGDHENCLVYSVIRAALNKQEILLGPCDQLWSYLEIRDCTSAVCLLVTNDNAKSDIYDIAGEPSCFLKKYVIQINKICGNGAFLSFNKRKNNAEGDVDLNPDLKKIKQLGFIQKISFIDGIKELKEKIGAKYESE